VIIFIRNSDLRSVQNCTKRKIISLTNLILDINLNRGKTSEGGSDILYQQTKESFKREQAWRLRMILKFELNTKKNITALAVPVLNHSFFN
jgi:hypothetical protein